MVVEGILLRTAVPAGFAPIMSVNGTEVGTQPVSVNVDEGTTEVAVIS